MRGWIVLLLAWVLACHGTIAGDPEDTQLEGPTLLPANQFTLGGQQAWFHDEGLSYGYFHTYDALRVGGPGDAPRKVHILLPWGYEGSGQRYPVVYMNDGDTAFWPGGAANKSWRVAQTLGTLAAQGVIREVIVVAVHPLNREQEYTHAFWAVGRSCCGAAGYSDYMADKVKGFVDANYRTLPGPQETAIVGSSHGGLVAFYAATRRPDRFGKAGALSPSFWAGLDLNLIASPAPLSGSALLQQSGPALASPQRPSLWIDWGLRRDGGFHNSVIEALAASRGEEMVDLLTSSFGYQEGANLFVHVDPIGGHDEDAWAYRFGLLMRAFFPR